MTYKNWKSSFNKWNKILEGAKEGNPIDAMGKCGYCCEYMGFHGSCTKCPLFKNKYCDNDMLHDTVFSQYYDLYNHLTEICSDSLCKESCLELVKIAKKMLKRIEKDNPSKK